MPGLRGLDWRTFGPLDLAKIAATAQAWCGNTVRLQLNQDNLLSPEGTGLDQAYLKAIETEVTAAERDRSAQNLFWIEGPDISSSFAGMVSQGALLKTSGVVYSLHHPAGPHDASTWDAEFGYLVTTGAAPVVNGEWTNYEPAPTAGPAAPRSSCWQDAPATVPAYLNYLAAHGIGLNVYQLQPGYMIKSYRDLSDPTTINPGSWSCLPSREPQPGQGAGSLVLAWFRQRNGQPA